MRSTKARPNSSPRCELTPVYPLTASIATSRMAFVHPLALAPPSPTVCSSPKLARLQKANTFGCSSRCRRFALLPPMHRHRCSFVQPHSGAILVSLRRFGSVSFLSLRASPMPSPTKLTVSSANSKTKFLKSGACVDTCGDGLYPDGEQLARHSSSRASWAQLTFYLLSSLAHLPGLYWQRSYLQHIWCP